MPRTFNPFANDAYPTDPAWGQIGNNLATALFGDPEMAAQMQLRKAQMDQLQSEAEYNRARAEGQGYSNTAQQQRLTLANDPSALYASHGGSAVPTTPNFPSASIANVPVTAVAPSGATPGPMTSDAVSSLVRSLLPNAVITSGARDPNSALGRADPHSYHNIGQAIDMRAVPGMTMAQVRDQLAAHGVPIAEAIDEYKNPSPHATGGHWHFAFGPNPSRGTIPVTGGGVTTNSPAAMINQPVLAPEPEGDTVDRNALTRLAILSSVAGDSGAITPLVQAVLAQAGGDQNARAALIAGGHSPSADFAASREAQLNNAAIDQYGGLAKTLAQESLQQAGSTQRTNLEQAGQTARNNADNRTRLQIEGNKPNAESGGGLTDDAVQQVAEQAIMNGGAIPPGWARSQNARIAIQNRVSEISKQNGMSVPEMMALGSSNKADMSAVIHLGKQAAVNNAAEGTALKNGEIVKELGKQLGNGNVAIFNKWKFDWKRSMNDPSVAGFAGALDTFANEYAKVTAGGGQSTDALRQQAHDALNAAMDYPTLVKTLGVLSRDMHSRSASYEEQRRALLDRVRSGNAGNTATPSSARGRPPLSSFKH